jgi:paraquat-inducible protein A
MTGTAESPQGTNFSKWRRKLNIILFLAFILFVIGLFAPILTFQKFYIFTNRVSILNGLFQLLREGHIILFSMIFLFTIVLPSIKIVFLCRALNGDVGNLAKHRRLLERIAKYGKWSMLDVFVVSVLIVTVKLGAIADVDVHIGLYAFAASVILTMLVTWKVFSLSSPSP